MTTKTKAQPNRYDIVGSFLRTPELKDATAKFRSGELNQGEFKVIRQEQTQQLVEKEVAHGLKDVTDGEFNRSWWHLDFLWGLNGVDKYDYKESYKFEGAHTRTDNAELTGKVSFNPDHPFFETFEYLQSITPDGVTPKQTIPSPTMLFRDNRSDNWPNFYDTREAYLDDLAKAYHLTILHFYELGARYVQIDDTTWAFLISKLNETKDDQTEHAKYVKLAEEGVQVINSAIADLPEDLTVTTHICRGNFKSTFLFSGGYEAVAQYLGQLNYDEFFLEYDNNRAGDLSPIKTIWNNRPNTIIVLGLITSKDGQLEDRKQVIHRVNEATEFVPLENLAISTQCGFASTEEGNAITEADQWAKIDLVKSIADEIWK